MVLTDFVSSPTPVILRQRATFSRRCSAGQHGTARGVMYCTSVIVPTYGQFSSASARACRIFRTESLAFSLHRTICAIHWCALAASPPDPQDFLSRKVPLQQINLNKKGTIRVCVALC
jgi:hypothetical protein